MDFSSRNTQRAAPRPTATAVPASPSATHKNTEASAQKSPFGTGIKLLGIILFISTLVLIVAAIISIAFRSDETAYVNKDGYQVVALIDKQAYFGKITKITDSYLVIKDIYYIQGSTSTDQNNTDTASAPTLVKRGCEIHKPTDQMIVYREQINFWENIQSNGKVAEAIVQQKKDGQDCDKQAQQSTQQDTTDTEKKDETPASTSSDSAN